MLEYIPDPDMSYADRRLIIDYFYLRVLHKGRITKEIDRILPVYGFNDKGSSEELIQIKIREFLLNDLSSNYGIDLITFLKMTPKEQDFIVLTLRKHMDDVEKMMKEKKEKEQRDNG